MFKTAVFFILLLSSSTGILYSDNEEFFVTCDAPVIVGGGIARYFVYSESSRLSVRYSFAGVQGDTVFIEKSSVDSADGSESKEILKVFLSGKTSKKSGRIELGGHSFKLKMNDDGRLMVKEIKG